MITIDTAAFRCINPEALYDSTPNGYSHVVVIQPNMRIIHIAGQGGENKKGELSPNFDQQLQQVFYNIEIALNSAQAKFKDIAFLRVLIVDHNAEKLQILTDAILNIWKKSPLPVCTLIPVPCLALKDMQVEIEATAYTA